MFTELAAGCSKSRTTGRGKANFQDEPQEAPHPRMGRKKYNKEDARQKKKNREECVAQKQTGKKKTKQHDTIPFKKGLYLEQW